MGEEARRRTALTFLRRVVPEGDYFYSVSLVGDIGRNFEHRTFDSMVERSFALSSGGYNAYFALSAFARGHYKESERDKKAKFRTQANAVAQKALWLDIDCERPGKPYPTLKSAVEALQEFLVATKLPLPMIVCSGQGLHIYWPFTAPIPKHDWEYLAGRLKEATKIHGLHVDQSRTTDAASVLRLPGTLNYGRDQQVRPVRILHEGADYDPDLLRQFLGAAFPMATVQPAPSAPVVAVGAGATWMHDLAASFEGPKRHPGKILRECAQIRDAGPAPYPAWWGAMLVLKHCVDGEKVAQIVSAQDQSVAPDGTRRYTPEKTAEKYQLAVESPAGPTRCDTFDAANPGICFHCPYWGKITSPIQLGIPEGQATPVLAPAPVVSVTSDTATIEEGAPLTLELVPYVTKKFFVSPGGGIYWNKRTSLEGEEVGDEEAGQYTITPIKICDSELYIHSICIDNTQDTLQRTYLMRKRTPGRPEQDIRFSIDGALGVQQFGKWLGNHGLLPISPKYMGPMKEFMQTYLASVQASLPEIQVYTTFGWHRKEGRDMFVVGDKAYSSTGVERVNLDNRCAEMAARELTQAGDLDTWKQIPAMYHNLGQMEAQLFLCASFAAPFMRYGTGTATNLMLSLWDTVGGRGKSSLLQAVNSVWGHPTALMLGSNDTTVARYQVLAARKNLPVCMDELTMASEEQVAALLYDIANGREKRKSLASGAGLVRTGDWNTVTFCTSNRSLYEAMIRYSPQASAPAMRVLEFHCSFEDQSGTPEGVQIESTLQLLRDHYGLAGPQFLRKCFEQPDIFKTLPTRAAVFDKDTRRHSDERFWTYGLALILEAGRLAVEFGLLPFDIDALKLWCEESLVTLRHRIREEFSSARPTILTDFLMDKIGETLVVRHATRPKAMVDTGTTNDPYILLAPRSKLDIRFEQDSKRIYVRKRAFNDWCVARHISVSALLTTMATIGVWTDPGDDLSLSLGQGVSMLDRGRAIVYCFEGKKLGVALPELLTTAQLTQPDTLQEDQTS